MILPAYLVLGAESSGTRLMTKILMGAGCYGDDTHEQRLDTCLPRLAQSLVWRRSVPHAKQWVDIPDMLKTLRFNGYSPRVIVMSRDWQVCAKSQVEARHVSCEEEATANIARAYRHILSGLDETPYAIVNYEALILHAPQTLSGLFNVLGFPLSVTIQNENRKWLT